MKNPQGRPKGDAKEKMLRLKDELKKYLSLGMTYSDACNLVGIDYTTFYKWMHGKEPHHLIFQNDMNEAISKGKAKLMLAIYNNDNWQAKAWILERKYPDEFGKKERIEHSGEIKGNEKFVIEVVHTDSNKNIKKE